VLVLPGRACTKQRGRIARRRGWVSSVVGEPAAMRRVQAPIRRRQVPGGGHLNFDEQRVALAAAGADRGEAEPAARPAQLVHHRPDDAAA
jgi:hypothetical protein